MASFLELVAKFIYATKTNNKSDLVLVLKDMKNCLKEKNIDINVNVKSIIDTAEMIVEKIDDYTNDIEKLLSFQVNTLIIFLDNIEALVLIKRLDNL